MKLIAHMVDVSYIENIKENNLLPSKLNKSANNIYLKIKNIRRLPVNEYEDGTILGEERSDGWITKSHYSGKLLNGKYQIAFEPILEKGETIEDYYLSIKITNRNQKTEILRYCQENNLFFSSAFYEGGKFENRRGSSNNVAGKLFIEVNNIRNSVVERIIPVLILPSSLSLDDYLQMIRELREIREDLVINNSNNVGIGQRFIMKRDNIEDKIKELESVINRINKRPRTKLKPKYVKKNYNSINKMTYRTMIEKYMYPYKNTFTAIDYDEVTNIYENKVLKSVLIDIKEKLYEYENFFNNYVENEKFIISDARKVLKDKNGKVLEDARKGIMDERDELKKRIDLAKQNNSNFVLRNFRGDSLVIFKNSELNDSSIRVYYNEAKKVFTLSIKTLGNNIIGDKLKNNIGIYGCSLKIFLHTNNINEMKFLIDSIRGVRSKADIPGVPSVRMHIEGEIESYEIYREGQIGSYGAVTINYTSIYNFEGMQVREYSEEEKESFLKKYTNYEKYEENLGFMDSVLNKEKNIDNVKEKIDNSWELLRSKLDKLMKLSMFDGIEINKREVLKPTQIFINDPLYRKVYRIIRELNETTLISDMENTKTILMKSTCDIYEIWCLFKIIHILVVNQRWKLINSDEAAKGIEKFMELKEPFSNKQLSFDFIKELKDNLQIKLTLTYEGRVYYDENKYKKPDYQFIYIIKDMYGQERRIRSYLDAKYRNYSRQELDQRDKDLKGVAIGKYIKPYINTENEPQCSMIVHSDSNDKYVNWGGDLKERYKLGRELQCDLKSHGYGMFYALPSNVRHLVKFLRLLNEYHRKMHYVCWECGEVNDVDIQEKLTLGNKIKYHCKCNKCNEFWVKNHCSQDSNHYLVKHIDNYHLLNNKKKNPWHLICPVCGDGDEPEELF